MRAHKRDADTYRGGIRGIVELEILRQLEKELGDLISIQSFFDLIVGTSTGGIIALGLTARNWLVQ
jgi:patatin-like phospholipase/acyl hydrolase